MRRIKQIGLLITAVLMVFSMIACGKDEPIQQKELPKKESSTTPAETESKVPAIGKKIDIEGWDAEKDSYEYPSGDYEEGFNYGTIRGRWQTDIDIPMSEVFGNQSSQYKQMLSILDSMGMEVPSGTTKLIMRFTDESHMEGRIIQDNNAFFDMVIDILGTKEGLMQYYSLLYGVNYGMVDYAMAQIGTTPEEFSKEIVSLLDTVAGENRENLRTGKDISSTYVIRDNKIIFDGMDLCLEYQEDGTLKIYAGAGCEEEILEADGKDMSKK